MEKRYVRKRQKEVQAQRSNARALREAEKERDRRRSIAQGLGASSRRTKRSPLATAVPTYASDVSDDDRTSVTSSRGVEVEDVEVSKTSVMPVESAPVQSPQQQESEQADQSQSPSAVPPQSQQDLIASTLAESESASGTSVKSPQAEKVASNHSDTEAHDGESVHIPIVSGQSAATDAMPTLPSKPPSAGSTRDETHAPTDDVPSRVEDVGLSTTSNSDIASRKNGAGDVEEFGASSHSVKVAVAPLPPVSPTTRHEEVRGEVFVVGDGRHILIDGSKMGARPIEHKELSHAASSKVLLQHRHSFSSSGSLSLSPSRRRVGFSPLAREAAAAPEVKKSIISMPSASSDGGDGYSDDEYSDDFDAHSHHMDDAGEQNDDDGAPAALELTDTNNVEASQGGDMLPVGAAPFPASSTTAAVAAETEAKTTEATAETPTATAATATAPTAATATASEASSAVISRQAPPSGVSETVGRSVSPPKQTPSSTATPAGEPVVLGAVPVVRATSYEDLRPPAIRTSRSETQGTKVPTSTSSTSTRQIGTIDTVGSQVTTSVAFDSSAAPTFASTPSTWHPSHTPGNSVVARLVAATATSTPTNDSSTVTTAPSPILAHTFSSGALRLASRSSGQVSGTAAVLQRKVTWESGDSMGMPDKNDAAADWYSSFHDLLANGDGSGAEDGVGSNTSGTNTPTGSASVHSSALGAEEAVGEGGLVAGVLRSILSGHSFGVDELDGAPASTRSITPTSQVQVPAAVKPADCLAPAPIEPPSSEGASVHQAAEEAATSPRPHPEETNELNSSDQSVTPDAEPTGDPAMNPQASIELQVPLATAAEPAGHIEVPSANETAAAEPEPRASSEPQELVNNQELANTEVHDTESSAGPVEHVVESGTHGGLEKPTTETETVTEPEASDAGPSEIDGHTNSTSTPVGATTEDISRGPAVEESLGRRSSPPVPEPLAADVAPAAASPSAGVVDTTAPAGAAPNQGATPNALLQGDVASDLPSVDPPAATSVPMHADTDGRDEYADASDEYESDFDYSDDFD